MHTTIRNEFCLLPKSKIKAGEGIDNGNYPFFTSSDIKVSSLDSYEYDDEIVVIGTGGKPSCNYVNGKFSFSTDNYALKAKGKIEPKFLYYFLRKDGLATLQNGFHGAGLQHISKDYILNIEIPAFEKSKQQTIVRVLDDIHGMILACQKQLTLLDELVKSRFIEMFGGKDKNFLFSDCVNRMTKGPFGSAVKKDLYVSESEEAYKVYIQVNCIQKNELLGDYYISKDYFESKMKTFEVKGGDYLITCDGTLGKYVRLSDNPRKGIISASLLRVQLQEDKITPEYFESMWDFYLLDILKSQVRNGCLVHLPSAKVIGSEKIFLPSMYDQKRFASFKRQVDKSKFVVQERIKLYQELLNKKMDEYFN